MTAPRVLILEDEFFTALDLELLVHQQAPAAQVTICATVADARSALHDGFNFGLLDVDLLDGTSFEIAAVLRARDTPIAFISGSKLDEVPPGLQGVPFLPKPYDTPSVERIIRSALAKGFAA